mmetsp:Transcript_84340/g.136728  ORF Transcript_84340/g.136728 Transcript_84340/m.136728 type:complete len:109 (-) Transcript_84340:166-492(-)
MQPKSAQVQGTLTHAAGFIQRTQQHRSMRSRRRGVRFQRCSGVGDTTLSSRTPTHWRDQKDKARTQCEAPRCCVHCERHASCPPTGTPVPAHSLHSSGLDGTHEQAIP